MTKSLEGKVVEEVTHGRQNEPLPRLSQCYLCKTWALEKSLKPIEVPDQSGFIQKLACSKCLDQIMGGSTS